MQIRIKYFEIWISTDFVPQALPVPWSSDDLGTEASTLILPVVVSLINLIVPLIFSLVNKMEHYTNPRTNIYIGIMRSAL